jgi:hypothetical protein
MLRFCEFIKLAREREREKLREQRQLKKKMGEKKRAWFSFNHHCCLPTIYYIAELKFDFV